MRCPHCGVDDDRVVDSRPSRDGEGIRRRRVCLSCDDRFTTWERVERPELVVVKRSGERRTFDRANVLRGMRNAATGRGVSEADLERAAWAVERAVRDTDEREVTSQLIGAQVMVELQTLDQVAYVRFASVYGDFKDVEDFEEVLSTLRTGPDGDEVRGFERG